MTGVLGKFQVEHGLHGVRVVIRAHQLTGDCDTDREIDDAIEILKGDLDACAREMKRLTAIDRRGALFEGWPSGRDEALNA